MELHLKKIREAKNISQKELAEMLDITVSVISKFENGKLAPSPFRLQQIAKVLEVPMNELIEPDGVEEAAYIQSASDDCKISVLGGRYSNLSYGEKIFKSFMIKQANGHCELCGNEAPFKDTNGEPFLYVFKIKSDNLNFYDPQEYAVLCPNCANKLSILLNDDDISYLQDVAKNHKYKILKEEDIEH